MMTREMTAALESFATLPRPKQEKVIKKVTQQKGVNKSFRMLHAFKTFAEEVRHATQQERG